MKHKPQPISEAIQAAVQADGRSLYGLAKDSGIDYASLHRFVNCKRGLSLPSLDKLVAALGLELRPARESRATRKGR